VTGPQHAVLVFCPCGVQNDKRESVGFETEAYAIADTINVCCSLDSPLTHFNPVSLANTLGGISGSSFCHQARCLVHWGTRTARFLSD